MAGGQIDQIVNGQSILDYLRGNYNLKAQFMSTADWRLLCREAGFPGLEEQLDTVPPFNPRRMHAGDIGYCIATEE